MLIPTGTVRIGSNDVQTVNAVFNKANYSNEYDASGYKKANYSAEYAASGFDNENFTARMNSQNNSLWNASGANIFLREIVGFLMVGGYFLLLPPILAKTWLKGVYARMGPVRYSIFIVLLLIAISLPIKMYLRWFFNIKYIIAIPEFFFNI